MIEKTQELVRNWLMSNENIYESTILSYPSISSQQYILHYTTLSNFTKIYTNLHDLQKNIKFDNAKDFHKGVIYMMFQNPTSQKYVLIFKFTYIAIWYHKDQWIAWFIVILHWIDWVSFDSILLAQGIPQRISVSNYGNAHRKSFRAIWWMLQGLLKECSNSQQRPQIVFGIQFQEFRENFHQKPIGGTIIP